MFVCFFGPSVVTRRRRRRRREEMPSVRCRFVSSDSSVTFFSCVCVWMMRRCVPVVRISFDASSRDVDLIGGVRCGLAKEQRSTVDSHPWAFSLLVTHVPPPQVQPVTVVVRALTPHSGVRLFAAAVHFCGTHVAAAAFTAFHGTIVHGRRPRRMHAMHNILDWDGLRQHKTSGWVCKRKGVFFARPFYKSRVCAK